MFGAGGSVGSQDWMKAALTARAAGLDPKSMRFVAFEGGGEAITALQGGHVQVYSGDASEAEEQIKAGAKIRVLAVLADKRLEGSMGSVPTMKELGFDVQWPIIRGFYMGPKVSDADFKVWSDTFAKMMATPVRQAAGRARPVQVCADGQGARRVHQGAHGGVPPAGRRLSPEGRPVGRTGAEAARAAPAVSLCPCLPF